MPASIATLIDTECYPFHDLTLERSRDLVAEARQSLARDGMFDLAGFVRPEAVARCARELQPLLDRESFTHRRKHNIYFRKAIAGLDPDHPALREVETVNHTLCADQMRQSAVTAIYRWAPLRNFLAAAMEKPTLHLMDDELACVNVMAYRENEALNWHFDRAEFTTTLLLQAPEQGGAFEYRSELRTADDPNYDGVARLLRGEDRAVQRRSLSPGTLNVFKGRNTAHRVTPIKGNRNRIIAVFSYYEQPGVAFTPEERIGFYGRA